MASHNTHAHWGYYRLSSSNNPIWRWGRRRVTCSLTPFIYFFGGQRMGQKKIGRPTRYSYFLFHPFTTKLWCDCVCCLLSLVVNINQVLELHLIGALKLECNHSCFDGENIQGTSQKFWRINLLIMKNSSRLTWHAANNGQIPFAVVI